MEKLPIKVNQRYKSSTRIDSKPVDYKVFIDDFILHGTAVSVLDTLSRDFSGSDQRAYTLTGPYGSGKSTFALFLSNLLSSNQNERDYAVSKLKKAGKLLSDFSSRFKVEKGWKVIKHVCGLEAPANSMLASLCMELGVDFERSEIEELSDHQCLNQIKSIIESSEGSDGVVLFIDEMGKALDYQSKANKDLYLFQSLADIAQQTSKKFLIIGFLHQSFSDYAKNKDLKTQKEWAKVQGRYKDLSFNPSIDESLVLVGDSIAKDEKIKKQLEKKYFGLVSHVSKSFDKQESNKDALLNTLPLDPIVSLLLGPISRRRFSQNERSLFGFLASSEKLAFRSFLNSNYAEANSVLRLYEPEMLWDYLHLNLHHHIITSSDSKAWLEGCDAINRATQKGSELHVSITKIIALLTIFGFHHHLHAKRNFIDKYFVKRGVKRADVSAAISDLESWTVIIYRQKHDALFVFQGSDIDIHNLVLERIESISEGVNWTDVCDIPQNILASTHYHKLGTMRWANTKLVDKINSKLKESLKEVPLTGEPFLKFLLPTNQNVSDQLNDIASDCPHIVVGQIDTLDELKTIAIEYIALSQIEKDEVKISHDLIAKNELENRLGYAQKRLEEELSLAFGNAQWTHLGKRLPKSPLSVVASSVADIVYHSSPRVINELVNRSKPSGSANSAIRKLMYAMLENGDQEDLGFDVDSFPPEKGIYLSCIKSTGWHCKTDEGYMFPSQWSKSAKKENRNMYALWEDGAEFIKSSDEMVTMNDLYQHWMKPPFGISAGLCRLYGLALLKTLEGQVAFYDMDSTKQFIFIPELDEELVTKIYKHPMEAGVRYFKISEIQTHLLSTLASSTIGEGAKGDAILAIAKHIVNIVHRLPSWVKKTSGKSFVKDDDSLGLTNAARDFRNKVIGANDPYKLILEDLPDIFGLDRNDKQLDTKLSQNLKTAIEDLSAQHDMLLAGYKNILLTSLSAEFDEALKRRCKLIVDTAQRPNVKELASRIIQYIDGSSKFELIINLAAGAPERNWTDKHLMNGLDELQNLCTQFLRIESFGKLDTNSVTQAISFMTKDKDGNHVSFEGFTKFGLEEDDEVRSAIKTVKSSIVEMPKEKQLAALTNLIASLMDPSEMENAYE